MKISELNIGEVYAIQPWGNIYDIDNLPHYISDVTNAELIGVERLGGSKHALKFKLLHSHGLARVTFYSHYYHYASTAPGAEMTITSLRRVLGTWKTFTAAYDLAERVEAAREQAMSDLREEVSQLSAQFEPHGASAELYGWNDPRDCQLIIRGTALSLLPMMKEFLREQELAATKPTLSELEAESLAEAIDAGDGSAPEVIDLLLGH